MPASKPKSPLARWSPKLTEPRAPSLKQPWASLMKSKLPARHLHYTLASCLSCLLTNPNRLAEILTA